MHSIEWAAGLFEGEGCITWRDKDHKRPQLKLGMTDLDVVEKFKEVVMCGSIVHDHSCRKAHWKPFFVWRTTGKRDVRNLLSKLLPYFGNRRAYKALNILDDLELA